MSLPGAKGLSLTKADDGRERPTQETRKNAPDLGRFQADPGAFFYAFIRPKSATKRSQYRSGNGSGPRRGVRSMLNSIRIVCIWVENKYQTVSLSRSWSVPVRRRIAQKPGYCGGFAVEGAALPDLGMVGYVMAAPDSE